MKLKKTFYTQSSELYITDVCVLNFCNKLGYSYV